MCFCTRCISAHESSKVAADKKRLKCPTCGQSKTDLKKDFTCHYCGNIVKETIYDHGPSSAKGEIVEYEWENYPSANMSYEEFRGLTY